MLFAFGSNGNGQLGLGHKEDTHVPTKCVMPANCPSGNPKKIVAGGNHTLVLYPCGTILATGSNEHGQCGIPPTESTKSFTEFQVVPPPPPEDGDKWQDISACWESSIFVTPKGKVYTCGLGNKGELGHRSQITSSPTLLKVPVPSYYPVQTVTSGMSHTLAVGVDKTIYGWGAGRKEQFGGPFMAIAPPHKIVTLGAAAVACGREFSVVILDREGLTHDVFGGGKYGIAKDQPPQGALKGWKSLHASWGGVYVLMKDGTITAWGRNDKGQLPPQGLKGVEELAVGSEHAVAIVTDEERRKKVIAWGWGEHGNCGRSRDENGGDVLGEIFEVPGTEDIGKVVGVGAGCATSWIWTE